MIELDEDLPADTSTVLDAFSSHQDEAFRIFRGKYLSRGGSNITAQGFPGVLDRVKYDKISRLTKISNILSIVRMNKGNIDASDMLSAMRATDVTDLDAADDLYDIANYAIIMIMLLRGEWR